MQYISNNKANEDNKSKQEKRNETSLTHFYKQKQPKSKRKTKTNNRRLNKQKKGTVIVL